MRKFGWLDYSILVRSSSMLPDFNKPLSPQVFDRAVNGVNFHNQARTNVSVFSTPDAFSKMPQWDIFPRLPVHPRSPEYKNQNLLLGLS